MSRSRAALPFLALLAAASLHAIARETDRALGLVLRSELAPAGVLGETARALAAQGIAGPLRVWAWTAGLALVFLVLALQRARAEGVGVVEALGRERALVAVLLLRPALTLSALAALAVDPSYPYGFTLPVALTQDWGIGQDALALAVFAASRMPPLTIRAPGARDVFLLSFLGYALLAPGWARSWEGHPGNEPKYLRQAVALAHWLSFDAEPVSTAMEALPTRPAAEMLRSASATLLRESVLMAGAVLRGEAGREAIRATRVTRQTVRGKAGGVYYVLAPGPSLLLAPTLRADRALNLAGGTQGRLALTLLCWNAMGALLVAVLFQLVRDATGRAGLAAALALFFSLLPPFQFFHYQFYPEMPAALGLGVLFGTLAQQPQRLVRHPWLVGWLLASLPWLHQKFLPVWAVLTLTAAVVLWRQARRLPPLLGLVLPAALSLYLTALYNFAITGSVRPDALFLAWGPAGVTTARVGQGVLGLWLDARYGLLPYVPVFLLAWVGLLQGGGRRFAIVLPSALVYFLTVASADNWAGAVCNLGRYLLPIAPLGVALAGVALADGSDRRLPRGAVAIALALAAWSALVAFALHEDPVAANDSALLLAKSVYADGHVYVPHLHIRQWTQAAPGLWARVAAWFAAFAALAFGFRRVRSPLRAAAALLLAVSTLAFVLERWPTRRDAPAFRNAVDLDPQTRLFFTGAVQAREDGIIAGPGPVLVERRCRSACASGLSATIGGTGVLSAAGRPPLLLRPAGAVVELPLLTYHEVAGRDGRRAVFSRVRMTVSGQAVMRFGPREPGASPGSVPFLGTAAEAPRAPAEGAADGSRGSGTAEPGPYGLR